jgi:hypothetical protein
VTVGASPPLYLVDWPLWGRVFGHGLCSYLTEMKPMIANFGKKTRSEG